MKNKDTFYQRFYTNLNSRMKDMNSSTNINKIINSAFSLKKETIYTLELSYGGQADGFKIYFNPISNEIEDIKYYYSDWFEFHERSLSDNDFNKFKPYFESII